MIIITFNNLYLRFLKIVQSHVSKVKIHVLNDTQGKVSFLSYVSYVFFQMALCLYKQIKIYCYSSPLFYISHINKTYTVFYVLLFFT